MHYCARRRVDEAIRDYPGRTRAFGYLVRVPTNIRRGFDSATIERSLHGKVLNYWEPKKSIARHGILPPLTEISQPPESLLGAQNGRQALPIQSPPASER